MSAPESWIPLVLTLVTLAATWGEVRARLKAVEKLAAKTATDTDRSKGAQGARIGSLEDRVAGMEGHLGLRRRKTFAGGVPIATTVASEDESGAEE